RAAAWPARRTRTTDGVERGELRVLLTTLRGVACRAPGEPFRLALVRDPGLDELVVARLGPLHGVPLALLAGATPPGLCAVNGHPVAHPRYAVHFLHSPSPYSRLPSPRCKRGLYRMGGC